MNMYPDQYNEWHAAVTDSREKFRQELSVRQDKVFRDLDRQEVPLTRALRDEVVGDVMGLFP
jgi:hypothetical protein